MKAQSIFVLIIVVFFNAGCDEENKDSATTGPVVNMNITVSQMNWGTVVTNVNSDKVFSFTNDPGSQGELEGVVSITGRGFYLVNGGGIFHLGARQSHSVKVRFRAESAGAYTGAVQIQHNAGNKAKPLTISLSATAVEQ